MPTEKVAGPSFCRALSVCSNRAATQTNVLKPQNRHAKKHFYSMEHSFVQSFEPGEDWIFCYVDKVVIEPR